MPHGVRRLRPLSSPESVVSAVKETRGLCGHRPGARLSVVRGLCRKRRRPSGWHRRARSCRMCSTVPIVARCKTSPMSEPVAFVGHDLVRFRPYRTWVDLKYFAIRPEASSYTVLADLIGHEQYHDHYAGQDPTDQSHHALHGPYRLEAITPAEFQLVSAQAAREELRDWAFSWVVPDKDGPAVEAKLVAEVLPKLEGGSIYRLRDLRETAEHEWGWVVGHAGFYEFVIIDPAAKELTLLVASDD